MANLDATASAWAPRFLSVLRIMSGLLLLQHGTMKYFDFPNNDWFDGGLDTMMKVAGAIEVVGGVLLVIGLLTRPVAFICSGFAAAAYFIGHAKDGFFPALNGGEAAVLFCFIFLYLACAGGGVWSVDAARGKA